MKHFAFTGSSIIVALVLCTSCAASRVPVGDNGSDGGASDMSADAAHDSGVVQDAGALDSGSECTVVLTPTSDLITTESGGTATFTVVLTCAPTYTVYVLFSMNNAYEGTRSPMSVTFTTENWATPQTITVTGVDDDVVDGDVSYQTGVSHVSSLDPVYNNLDVAQRLTITNRDNDPSVDVGCGGPDDCAATDYCAFSIENPCGSSTVRGNCASRPSACTADLSPVCACNGAMFDNACEAKRAGYDIANAGSCAP